MCLIRTARDRYSMMLTNRLRCRLLLQPLRTHRIPTEVERRLSIVNKVEAEAKLNRALVRRDATLAGALTA